MKKAISAILTVVILLLALASCNRSQNPPSPSQSPSPSHTPMEESDWIVDPPGDYDGRMFSSIEELYQGLLDYSEEALETIREKEEQDISDKIHLSAGEIENGIFGNFRNTLLESEALMYPYYQDERLPLSSFFGAPKERIALHESGSFQKPSIAFYGKIDDETFLSFELTFFSSKLADKMHENEVYWLLSQLDPYHFGNTNVRNYADIEQGLIGEVFASESGLITYEKEIALGDRDVIAVFNRAEVVWPSSLRVFFLYDDVLVCVSSLPHHVEAVLPHLTFREIHMPTGEPLRDTPGRAWD